MSRSLAKGCGRSWRERSVARLRSFLADRFATALLLACAFALVLALGAHAQTAAPSISGVGAREVTDTTALLAGEVNPNGSHTTYRFEYGTDTSYGNATAVDNAGSGAAGVPATKAVTGLQPNTTYHFRLVATNAVDETQGTDHTYTTAANPPPPSGRVY
jgi:phosphodiesterase/alkaline phosphatase D-like protein